MKRYADHVRTLLRQHKIRVRYLPRHADLKAETGVYGPREIGILPIVSPRNYAVALHEIGHIVTQTLHQPVLLKEGAAWQWAKENALKWSQPMQRAMLLGLQSYVQRAVYDYQKALPGQLRLPPVGHVFWSLAKPLKETKQLLELTGTAPWLAPHLPVIPWGNVLANPSRPRCSNCHFWNPAVAYEADPSQPTEKQVWGFCKHISTPLGVEMTPGGALCGTSWTSNT